MCATIHPPNPVISGRDEEIVGVFWHVGMHPSSEGDLHCHDVFLVPSTKMDVFASMLLLLLSRADSPG